jgi:multidrug transporter EmrE-like cation transporter
VGSNRNKRKRAEKIENSGDAGTLVWGLPWAALAPLGISLLAVVAVVIARVRLLGIPLERDEGEYAYIGNLMLQGVAPYGVAANMKLPGTNAAYALLMAIFGRSIVGIHVGFLLVNLATIALVGVLGKRLFGKAAGIAAAASYAVLSVGMGVLGMAAHATHFVILPALGGTILLLRWAENRKWAELIGSGLLFGLAFLMKQPGILLVVFGVLCLLYCQRREKWADFARNVLVFGAATLLPFGVTCALLWRAGVFGKFWLWVFTYARSYVSMRPLAVGVRAFEIGAAPIFWDNVGICVLAVVGLVLLWRDRERREAAVIATLFLGCSFLAVCPGLYFRQHYFVLVLPAMALLVGAAATMPRSAMALWLVAGALSYSVVRQSDYLFRMTPDEICAAEYGRNPFPEAIPVADYIRTHTSAGERIVVLGSEPEIYFYAERRAVTPYVYVYPLVENQPLAPLMQADFIRDVESAKPEYLVVVNVSASWLIQPGAPSGLFRWMSPYYERRYQQVGVVDLSPQGTIYRWDAEAASYRPRSSNYLLIMRRKS